MQQQPGLGTPPGTGAMTGDIHVYLVFQRPTGSVCSALSGALERGGDALRVGRLQDTNLGGDPGDQLGGSDVEGEAQRLGPFRSNAPAPPGTSLLSSGATKPTTEAHVYG